jgi:hypothetical protein
VACDIRGCAGNFGWSAYGAPSAAEARPVDYAEGQLMLDLVDSRSGRLAWRAVSTKRVDGNDATQDGLTAIVVDMTKALPGAAPAHVGG